MGEKSSIALLQINILHCQQKEQGGQQRSVQVTCTACTAVGKTTLNNKARSLIHYQIIIGSTN